jgi:hypothetical protein
MQTPPGTAELARLADISLSYASEIVNRKRAPSRRLAIHILRKTEWRHPVLADLSDEQIATLEQIEPWKSGAAA